MTSNSNLDEDVIKRAEEAIAGMKDEYLEWAAQDLEKMEQILALLRNSPQASAEDDIQKIFRIAHDVKGQGGSFGFDLMTIIGNQICRMIENSAPDNPELIEAVEVHADSMKLVISERLEGNGGERGRTILDGLQQVYTKITG